MGPPSEFLNKHCDQWEFNDRKLQGDWSDVGTIAHSTWAIEPADKA